MWVLGTNVSEILIKMCTFSLKKMLLKMSSGKRRPSCLGLSVLKDALYTQCYSIATDENISWTVMLCMSLYMITLLMDDPSTAVFSRQIHPSCVQDYKLLLKAQMYSKAIHERLSDLNYLQHLLNWAWQKYLPYIFLASKPVINVAPTSSLISIEYRQYWCRNYILEIEIRRCDLLRSLNEKSILFVINIIVQLHPTETHARKYLSMSLSKSSYTKWIHLECYS